MWSRRLVVGGLACSVLLFLAIVGHNRPAGVSPPPPAPRIVEAPACRPTREAPCPLCTLPPFAEAFKELDWDRMKAERDANGMYSGKSLEEYLRVLGRYLAPKLPPPRVSQRPTPLRVDCQKYPTVLTGKARAQPVKVFDLVVLGYELDLLEARFYELDESVDVFVVLEGARAHRGYRKPLFFQENLARYDAFLNKTMYLVVDDGDVWKHRQDWHKPDGKMMANEVPQKWEIEVFQRDDLYRRFMLAYGESQIGPDDLFIHGDMDEIPDGDVIFQMKHCETRLPAGFCPQGYTNHMRFPHRSREKQSCFQPSVFRRQEIEKNKGKVLYRYAPPHRVDAGMHATITGSLALQLYKYLSVAEGGIGPDKPFEFLRNPMGIPLDMAANGRRVCCPSEGPQSAVHDDALLAKFWKPWFMAANAERFPDFLSHDMMLWKGEVGKRLRE